MGKPRDTTYEARQEHQSAPLTTLKDPASFGPPPKRINYHGASAADNTAIPDGSSWSAQAEAQRQAEIAAEAEETQPNPALPYRADTTGLSTDHLPKLPVRRVIEGGHPASSQGVPKPKPSLPPRLPPRQNSHPDLNAPSPPPTYNAAAQDSPVQPARNGYLNQASINRLAQADVTVRGFNIGPARTPQSPSHQPDRPALPSRRSAATASSPQLNELQSRFSRMASPPAVTPQQSSEETSWAQKQSAIKTANAFRTDPSSVSLSDARNAASTANSFHERHGTQIASGWTSTSTNQHYSIMDRTKVSAVLGQPVNAGNTNTVTAGSSTSSLKKPPPPPPKKKDIQTMLGSTPDPPPIPLSSKPRT